MKMRISHEQLLKDLPGMTGIVEQDSYIVNGRPMSDLEGRKIHTRLEEFYQTHPKIAEILSPIEFNIFCHLLEKLEKKTGASPAELIEYTNNPMSVKKDNVVATHIFHIRKKFEEHSIPFRINTPEYHVTKEPFYELEELFG